MHVPLIDCAPTDKVRKQLHPFLSEMCNISTYSRTYYEAIPVFSKTRIMEECTVLRMLGL